MDIELRNLDLSHLDAVAEMVVSDDLAIHKAAGRNITSEMANQGLFEAREHWRKMFNMCAKDEEKTTRIVGAFNNKSGSLLGVIFYGVSREEPQGFWGRLGEKVIDSYAKVLPPGPLLDSIRRGAVYSGLVKADPYFGAIDELRADPQHKGKGIRATLFRHAVKELRGLGMQSLKSYVVEDVEGDFYKRMGGVTRGQPTGRINDGSTVRIYEWPAKILDDLKLD